MAVYKISSPCGCVTPYNMIAVDVRGDPDHIEDHTVVQRAMDNPPQVGRVWAGYLWYNWRLRNGAYLNKCLTVNYFGGPMGPVTVGVETRQAWAGPVSGNNGSPTYLSGVTWTLTAPGQATIVGRDCPLVSEDGSALAPKPLSVVCFLTRRGFFGAAGQVVTPSYTAYYAGVCNLVMLPPSFSTVNDLNACQIYLTSSTGDFGAESDYTAVWCMDLVSSPVTPSGPTSVYSWPACGAPTQQFCYILSSYAVNIHIKLLPIGTTYYTLIVLRTMQTSFAGGGLVQTAWSGTIATSFVCDDSNTVYFDLRRRRQF
jgi:hypothetical protein